MGPDNSAQSVDSVGMADCSCKVGRVADRYDLSGLDEELVVRWSGDGEGKSSLRDLEAYVNKRTLRSALESVDAGLIEGEVDNYYRLLNDEGESSASRVDAERRLERQGIDPDRLRSDFVSHQTVHKHLRECLDETYETPDPETRVENARSFIEATRTRTESMSERTLQQLRDAGVLDLEEFDVFVDLMVSCDSCGRFVTVSDVFENGGCVCQDDDRPRS